MDTVVDLQKPKEKMEPVTIDMLSALVYSMGVPASLRELSLVASCVLAFAAFLHFDKQEKN